MNGIWTFKLHDQNGIEFRHVIHSAIGSCPKCGEMARTARCEAPVDQVITEPAKRVPPYLERTLTIEPCGHSFAVIEASVHV